MKGALIHTDPLWANTSNLSTRSLDVSCSFLRFFAHTNLSLPRFWFPASLTFLSCQHSQALRRLGIDIASIR